MAFRSSFAFVSAWERTTEGTVVARYGADDHLLPRVAPVVVSFPATKATWVRLEATTLSPRGWDGMHILQLSEILVFSGLDNVALRQSVQVSSSDQLNRGLPRHKDYLVDGFVPYLMDAHDGEQSLAFVSRNCLGKTPILSIDLRSPEPLSSIHLHATELSDNVPQALTDDFGIPRSLVIEGATKPDFSDATTALRLSDGVHLRRGADHHASVSRNDLPLRSTDRYRAEYSLWRRRNASASRFRRDRSFC